MSKKTADGLLRKTSGILESLYLALRDTVLKADYLNIDETYYRILHSRRHLAGQQPLRDAEPVCIQVKAQLTVLHNGRWCLERGNVLLADIVLHA